MEKRTVQIELTRVNEEDMTCDATLSTEYPVRRFDGDEVLSHDPGAVDLSRAPLPLIVGHDNGGLPVGIVEDLAVVGRKLKGKLRFSKNAGNIWQDVKDGILRNLSIGYQILKRTSTKGGYIATKWVPYECSLVSAPADPMSGIGRGIETGGFKTMDKNDLLKERKRVTDAMIEMASKDLTSDDKEAFDRLKEGLEGIDRRLEVMDTVSGLKKQDPPPEVVNKDRALVSLPGVRPAYDRTFKGMFGDPKASESEIRAFRDIMETGIPSGGGVSLPEPLAAQWLDAALPDEQIRPRATVWPMSAMTLKVPGWDVADMSGGDIFGGFTMVWTAEGGTASKQTAKMRAITMTAKKGQVYCDVSQELFDDGQGFGGQLEIALKKSISYGLEQAFTNGSGAGCPQGITNSPAIISVAGETGQDSNVVFENLVKLYARMYAAGRPKAVFMVNDTCLPSLMQLNVSIGTAGSWVNVFNEKDGNFTIMGRPVLFTPHLPTLGTANDVLFVDLSQYAIGLRKDMRIERSNVPEWSKDLMSYRIIIRCDAMDTWGASYQPDNGDSQSWVVGLAAR